MHAGYTGKIQLMKKEIAIKATYVTGFVKTNPNRTRTEIHFLPNIKAGL